MKKNFEISANSSAVLDAIPCSNSRATRFAIAINTSSNSSPEYALAVNTLKKLKVMLPLFKFYMDNLVKTGQSPEYLVLNHKKVNEKILMEIQ